MLEHNDDNNDMNNDENIEQDKDDFYRCSCGFKTDDLSEFRRHTLMGKKEPGKHKSLGTKPANPKGVTPKGSKKAERGAKAQGFLGCL